GFGVLLALLQGTPAQAVTFTKTYVSNTGSDANNCASVASACASFATAAKATSFGGEITVVNTGDYGPVIINQSVSITNDGAGEAGVTPPSASVGIAISAGVGDVVSLRGLVIDGHNVAAGGIVISQASAVHIQNCMVRNIQLSGLGVLVQTTSNTQLFISDTIIYNNGSTALTGGIWLQPIGSNSVNAVFDRIHLENNVFGLRVDGGAGSVNGVHVVIRDSVVSGNASDGIQAVTVAGKAPAFLLVENTAVVNNAGTGILASGPHATVLLDGNVISRNSAGISAFSSGQLISYGNNKVNNNVGADGAPTSSFSPI